MAMKMKMYIAHRRPILMHHAQFWHSAPASYHLTSPHLISPRLLLDDESTFRFYMETDGTLDDGIFNLPWVRVGHRAFLYGTEGKRIRCWTNAISHLLRDMYSLYLHCIAIFMAFKGVTENEKIACPITIIRQVIIITESRRSSIRLWAFMFISEYIIFIVWHSTFFASQDFPFRSVHCAQQQHKQRTPNQKNGHAHI